MYKILITNLETNEEIISGEYDLIAASCTDEEGTNNRIVGSANPIQIASAIIGLREMDTSLSGKCPHADLLIKLIEQSENAENGEEKEQ